MLPFIVYIDMQSKTLVVWMTCNCHMFIQQQVDETAHGSEGKGKNGEEIGPYVLVNRKQIHETVYLNHQGF